MNLQGFDPIAPFLADVVARLAEVQSGPVDALRPDGAGIDQRQPCGLQVPVLDDLPGLPPSSYPVLLVPVPVLRLSQAIGGHLPHGAGDMGMGISGVLLCDLGHV